MDWLNKSKSSLFATALALFAIIVLPFIEQHRRPFSSPITANNLLLVAPPTTTGATPSINLEQDKENEIVKKVNSLSPGDKERLSTALFQLSSVLDSSETTHDMLWQIKTAKPMTPAVLIPKLDELKIAASSLSSRIYAEINQRYFQEIMTQITEVPASSDATGQSLTQLLSTLGTIADEYEKYLYNPKNGKAKKGDVTLELKRDCPKLTVNVIWNEVILEYSRQMIMYVAKYI